MFKFLPGILLIQLTSAGLMFFAVYWSLDTQLLIALLIFSVIITILAMFWFSSIAHNVNSSAYSKLEVKHAREREQLLIKAERAKAKAVTASQKHMKQVDNKTVAKANFKVGLAVAGAVGVGALMFISQLVTVGLMFMIAGGSGMAGYLTRVRQEGLKKDDDQLSLQKKIIPGLKKFKR